MTLPYCDIASLVRMAFRDAAGMPDVDSSLRIVHQTRSRAFVEALAARLRRFYAPSDGFFVLSKHYPENRSRFGLNELLYDVCVCRASETSSAHQGEQLTFVTDAVWAIESEFARDTREALFDFNKLVLSAAPWKLFVGPHVADSSAYLGVLSKPADATGGLVHVALVPHPADWRSPSVDAPSVFAWRDHQWVVATPAA